MVVVMLFVCGVWLCMSVVICIFGVSVSVSVDVVWFNVVCISVCDSCVGVGWNSV